MKLTIDRNFRPCPIEVGDECYPNGVFEFNITRLLAFVDAHADQFQIAPIALAEISTIGDSKLNPETMRTADLSRPIVLAEIAPNRYNVIDGHHRVGRARREGLQWLPGRRIRCPVHVAFLTSTIAYVRYVEYWNSKLESPQAQSSAHSRRNTRYMQDVARAQAVATSITGDAVKAASLLRNEPLRAFEYKTADALIKEGRTDAVIAYLESLANGAAG